uniref:Uncharacterized protein n=1 Tax=viral metagenome TaxID=1070528 RepID=A0A6C0CNE3_9ZZZZ
MSELVETNTFPEDIQKFILLDEEIQKIQERLKILREEKQNTQSKISNKMVENNWQKRAIDAGSYQLSMIERKQYSSITFTYLEEQLSKIIPDKAQVDYVIQYLKNNRQVKQVQEIRSVKKS